MYFYFGSLEMRWIFEAETARKSDYFLELSSYERCTMGVIAVRWVTNPYWCMLREGKWRLERFTSLLVLIPCITNETITIFSILVYIYI